MSTAAPYNARPRTMKTRDKIKYAFATVLALFTLMAIAGLLIARHQRRQTTAAEELMLQHTISVYGQNGALPDKIEMPDAPSAGAATFR